MEILKNVNWTEIAAFLVVSGGIRNIISRVLKTLDVNEEVAKVSDQLTSLKKEHTELQNKLINVEFMVKLLLADKGIDKENHGK